MPPAIARTMETTMAVTGRFINVFAIIQEDVWR
jgi:hypothetical protein